MPIGIDVRGPGAPEAAIDEAFALLRRADALFSTYRADSEISRLESGELAVEDAGAEVREVLAECERLREATGGAFDVRATGRLDPSGLVKGWAAERAAAALLGAGARHLCVNAAGDVRVAGGRPDGGPWRVGVRDPRRADRLCAVLALHDGAVATSGAYERGEHVIDPRTRRPARGLLCATVTGPDLATADAYATALLVMGPEGLDWVAAKPGCGALVVTPDGRLLCTPRAAAARCG